MKYIATSILSASLEKAPKEFEDIDDLQKLKPKGEYEKVELMRVVKSSVVAWCVLVKGGWKLASGYFVVSKQQEQWRRGARYSSEKEVFVKKHWDVLYDLIVTKRTHWKNPEAIAIVRLAQDEVGYSPVTAYCDVWRMIGNEFMKQYKGEK